MPPRRFLIRSSILLAGMVLLWWLFLAGPLLAGLRVLAGFSLGLLPGAADTPAAFVLPSGAWDFRIPVPASLLNSAAPANDKAGFQRIQLQVRPSPLILFTLGFPIIWALIVSPPITGRLWRSLLMGTALMTLFEQIQLGLYLVFAVGTHLHLVTGAFAAWLLNYLGYLTMYCLPYTVPFAIAVAVHPPLRAILSPVATTRPGRAHGGGRH